MTEGDGLTVLLGAGASREAGLPMSYGLTQRITEAVEERHGRYYGTSQALNVAIGAMIANDTGRGLGAFSGIDVERLFSAVQMLAQRDEVELSPFVASWNPALEAVGRSRGMPSFFGKNLKEEIFKDRDTFGGGLERLFKDGVEAIVGRAVDPVFGRLEREMVDALRAVLAVDEGRVDYLAPLLDASSAPINIATLNYDRSVETVAARARRSCDTGVQNWTGGFDWTWAEQSADVRLLKLHGSIDWWYAPKEQQEHQLPEEGIEVDHSAEPSRWNARLALIFGQRGKVRADGPFLAMLRGFDDFLSHSKRLVVVGYSFRDEHINGAIRRWYNDTTTPQLTIIDPGLAGVMANFGRDRPDFLKELLRAITDRPRQPPFELSLRKPHEILDVPASEGLKRCFGDGPALAPVGDE